MVLVCSICQKKNQMESKPWKLVMLSGLFVGGPEIPRCKVADHSLLYIFSIFLAIAGVTWVLQIGGATVRASHVTQLFTFWHLFLKLHSSGTYFCNLPQAPMTAFYFWLICTCELKRTYQNHLYWCAFIACRVAWLSRSPRTMHVGMFSCTRTKAGCHLFYI